MKKLKLRKDIKPFGSSDGFWFDLTKGGYFKPEDVLSDKRQIEEVNKAIELLQDLESVYNEFGNEF